MLARAAMSRSNLLLADEPTAELDRTSAAQVAETLLGLARGGRAVLIASHDELVINMCPTVIRLGAPV